MNLPPTITSASRPLVTIQGRPQAAHRILVVDDDESVRFMSVEVLDRRGYQTGSAPDGLAAWEALQTTHYDLLITDHKMPKLSGIDLVRKMRSVRRILPVIMVTGNLPAEELNREPSLNISATVIKPYSINEFLKTVEDVLRVNYDSDRPQSKPLPPLQPPPDRLFF